MICVLTGCGSQLSAPGDESLWIGFAVLGALFLLAITGLVVSYVTDVKRQRRDQAMQAWLEARPSRTTRDKAAEVVAEALADTRITLEEHAEFIDTVETAMTNAEIDEITAQLVVVERPE